jgi:predicted porin
MTPIHMNTTKLTRRTGVRTYLGSAGVLAASLIAAAVAQAAPGDSSSGTPGTPDGNLTWNGITLYGIVDVGLQYQTHGVPVSDYFPAGTESIISKNSNGSVTGITPSNLSQSRIGLAGKEPIVADLNGIFRMETFFNTQSGQLSDGLKSLALNNGKSLNTQGTNVDTSVAGQAFAGALYAGLSSATYGTLTFGRHPTLIADGVSKYDPMGAAQAFSVIGFSGTAAGGGDTEDRRLDSSLKYTAKYDFVHFGALYQFNGANGAANTAEQVQLGADYGGGSIDAYYAKKRDAIAASALNTKQFDNLPTLGYSASNSLNATISDNTTYGAMLSYNFGAPTVFAGYEHIKFENPSTPLAAGSLTIGGYVLAYTTNDAYTINKVLQVYWAGAKVWATPELELTAAYYGYKQNSYAGGADAGCNTNVSAACSGTLNAFAALGDYHFTKRFDVYLGSMWSGVENGLSNDYLNKATITTTTGFRFKF